MAANVKPANDHGFIALAKKPRNNPRLFLCLGIKNRPKWRIFL